MRGTAAAGPKLGDGGSFRADTLRALCTSRQAECTRRGPRSFNGPLKLINGCKHYNHLVTRRNCVLASDRRTNRRMNFPPSFSNSTSRRPPRSRYFQDVRVGRDILFILHETRGKSRRNKKVKRRAVLGINSAKVALNVAFEEKSPVKTPSLGK